MPQVRGSQAGSGAGAGAATAAQRGGGDEAMTGADRDGESASTTQTPVTRARKARRRRVEDALAGREQTQQRPSTKAA
jgi:hypothetical protein